MSCSIDPHIKFTIEPKKDKQIAFLNMLISRRTDFISIHDYRKPTDRYLDNASQHDIKKISKATTLINTSLVFSTTEDSKSTELQHVNAALPSNI